MFSNAGTQLKRGDNTLLREGDYFLVVLYNTQTVYIGKDGKDRLKDKIRYWGNEWNVVEYSEVKIRY